MDRPSILRGSAGNAEPAGIPDTNLHGHWLLIARVSWIVLTLLILTLNAVTIPRYDAMLLGHCQPGPQCFALQLTAFDRQFLHRFGLPLGFLAAYQVMLDAVSVLVCCALGALIFWRKSADRMALFCAFMLVLFGGAGYTSILQETLAPVSPAWFALIGTLDVLGVSISKRETCTLSRYIGLESQTSILDEMLTREDCVRGETFPTSQPFSSVCL